MRLGIVTPVVTRLPGAHARWEADAGIDEITQVVVAAERLGYDFCTCSEHVAVPAEAAAARGGTYWDPLPTFGSLAARTERIRFATFVLVLGYHHPLAIAKRYGTLDQVSHGRVVLGVGVGSLEEEFALLGAEFEDRGAIGDDAIRALRASLVRARAEVRRRRTSPSVASSSIRPRCRSTYRSGSVVAPAGRCGARSSSPTGGRRSVSAARSSPRMLEQARDTDAWNARAEPLDVILQNDRPLDPMGEPDRVSEQLARYRDIGATALAARFVHHSLDHYLRAARRPRGTRSVGEPGSRRRFLWRARASKCSHP